MKFLFRQIFCCLCILFFLSQITLAHAEDWSMFLHDPSRTGVSGDTALTPSSVRAGMKLLWKHQTNGAIVGSPAVVGNAVYVGSWDGNLYSFNAANGNENWHNFLGQIQDITKDKSCNGVTIGISSSPAVAGNNVFVGGGDAKWYKFDLNGQNKSTLFAPPANLGTDSYMSWSSPLFYNGFVYIGLASDCDQPLIHAQLLKINPSSNTVVARFDVGSSSQTGGSIWSSPAVDPTTNTIYITTGNPPSGFHQPDSLSVNPLSDSIIALNATTLQEINAYQITNPIYDSDFGASPTVIHSSAGNFVAAANKNGFLYIMNIKSDGSLSLNRSIQIAIGGKDPELGNGSISSCTYSGTILYCAGGNTTIKGTNYQGSVRAIDLTKLGFVDPYLWEHGISGGWVMGALAYVNGMVVVNYGNKSSGALEILDANNNGASLYKFNQVGASLAGGPSIANGTIFFGSFDKNLYAIAPQNSNLGGNSFSIDDDVVTGSSYIWHYLSSSRGWSACSISKDTITPNLNKAYNCQNDPPYYSGSHHWSHTTGDYATVTFHGSEFVFSSVVGPNEGVATLTLDGGPIPNGKDKDCNPSDGRNINMLEPVKHGDTAAFSVVNLPNTDHVLKIFVTGNSADNNNQHNVVSFDRLYVGDPNASGAPGTVRTCAFSPTVLTSTPALVSETHQSILVKLHILGIDRANNNNPLNTIRMANLTIYNSNDVGGDIVQMIRNVTFAYDSATGLFVSPGIPLGNIPIGTYTLAAKIPNLTLNTVVGTFTLTSDSAQKQIVVPALGSTDADIPAIPVGDILDNNQIDILAYNLLLATYGCNNANTANPKNPLRPAQNCKSGVQNSSYGLFTDLNNDGRVDAIDFNLLIYNHSFGKKGI